MLSEDIKLKMKEGKHVFLLPDEMKRLEELSLINRNMHFQHTLDAFLFCCYTGLRYSDFTNLTEKNIVKNRQRIVADIQFCKNRH